MRLGCSYDFKEGKIFNIVVIVIIVDVVIVFVVFFLFSYKETIKEYTKESRKEEKKRIYLKKKLSNTKGVPRDGRPILTTITSSLDY